MTSLHVICGLPPTPQSKILAAHMSAGNIPTDKNKIFSRWREYFEGLLNPVKASTRGTQEVIHLEEVFTAAEVAERAKALFL